MRDKKKDNYSSPISRYMARMQQTPTRNYCKILVVVLAIGFICYLGKSTHTYISTDRSHEFHVQVFDRDSSDSMLSKLSKDSFSYMAMIDAGSSGCRAHVYRYGKLGTLDGPIYVVPQHDSKKVKPGLSTFAKNPGDAGASLQGLVDFVKSQVPEDQWKNTPIWLKATAGLRLVEKNEALAVLNSVRDFLGDAKNSPFYFRRSWARIISGNEEGGFGWIAFNYLKKIIGPKKIPGLDPYAVVEMGGASSQVSQVAPTKEDADAIPEEYRFSFDIEGEVFHLYTHSYLGFGAERAREALNALLLKGDNSGTEVQDPCLNNGYQRLAAQARKEVYEGPDGGPSLSVTGASKPINACSMAMPPLFATTGTCPVSGLTPYSFNCVYQPLFLSNSKNILLFENFFYTSSALGVRSAVIDADVERIAEVKGDPSSGRQLIPGTVERAPAAEGEGSAVVPLEVDSVPDSAVPKVVFPLLTNTKNILRAASEVCQMEWSDAQSLYPKDSQPKDTTLKLCFSSSYAAAFLRSGLGLPMDKTVTIQKEVDGSEIEWALGAAYKEVADFLKRSYLRSER